MGVAKHNMGLKLLPFECALVKFCGQYLMESISTWIKYAYF